MYILYFFHSIAMYVLHLLELEFDFQAVPSKEGYGICDDPLLQFSIAVEIGTGPVAIVQCGSSVMEIEFIN